MRGASGSLSKNVGTKVKDIPDEIFLQAFKMTKDLFARETKPDKSLTITEVYSRASEIIMANKNGNIKDKAKKKIADEIEKIARRINMEQHVYPDCANLIKYAEPEYYKNVYLNINPLQTKAPIFDSMSQGFFDYLIKKLETLVNKYESMK